MARLLKCDLIERDQIGDYCRKNIPSNSGVYVFYKGNRAMYVGRSDGLIDRIQTHGRDSSTSGQAAFAAWLVKERFFRRRFSTHAGKPIKALWRNSKFAKLKISDVRNDEDFANYFRQAKKTVRLMKVRVVHVEDPHAQAIFEVYAHMILSTPYNTFVNH